MKKLSENENTNVGPGQYLSIYNNPKEGKYKYTKINFYNNIK